MFWKLLFKISLPFAFVILIAAKVEPSTLKSSIKFSDPKSDIEEVKKIYNRQTNLIISVLIVSFIIMIIMVATLVIDSFHVNSATYKEYSEKTKSVEDTIKTNSELLNQNQKNQQVILEQQREIKDLLSR